MKNAVVIGAGVAGLSAAMELAYSGYNVQVVEKNSMPGGRAMVWKKNGYTFDMGPSWYMTPQFFERFFARFNKKTSSYYTLKKLDPAYAIYFQDQIFPFSTTTKTLKKQIEAIDPHVYSSFQQLLHESEKKYNATDKYLLFNPSDNWFDLLNPALLTNLLISNVHQTYHEEVKKYLSSPVLQAGLEFFTIFLGGSHHNMPAIYAQLLHMVFGQHIWYPEGGFGSVSYGFEKLAKEMGVTFHYNCPAEKIGIKDGNVSFVQTGKKDFEADIVIANAEIPHVEKVLLEKKYRDYSDEYWDKKVLSPTTLLVFLGLNKRIKDIHHHTVVFRDMDVHLESVFAKRGSWPENPSYYINAPSVTDRSLVPSGGESLMLLVPLSPNMSPNENQNARITKNIIQHLSQMVGMDINKHIVVQRTVAHEHFKNTFNAYKGGSFGLANTFTQTAWLRPAIRNKKVSGLYYAGHYTVPGVGFPTSMISGQLSAETAIKDSLSR